MSQRAAPGRGEVDAMLAWSVGQAESMSTEELRAITSPNGRGGDHERRVLQRAEDFRVEMEARALVQAEASGGVVLPSMRRLDAFLQEPDDEPNYRVDRLWPSGGMVVLAAPFKAGKSTLVGNLLRSLADGEPFLGVFPVRRAERVVLVDVELGDRTLRRWFEDQDIEETKRIWLTSIRGSQAAFDIQSRAGRETLATIIGRADVLIIDPLRPLLDVAGLDENHDVGRFLVALDELLMLAQIPEALIVHHMGHNSERSRGDSRLRDWPDVEWKLVRGATQADGRATATDDPSGERYFSAYGRDVDVAEGKLAFDPSTRNLTYLGGSRADSRRNVLIERLVEIVCQTPGIDKGGVEKAIGGKAALVRRAIDAAAESGLIRIRKEGQRHALYPASQ